MNGAAYNRLRQRRCLARGNRDHRQQMTVSKQARASRTTQQSNLNQERPGTALKQLRIAQSQSLAYAPNAVGLQSCRGRAQPELAIHIHCVALPARRNNLHVCTQTMLNEVKSRGQAPSQVARLSVSTAVHALQSERMSPRAHRQSPQRPARAFAAAMHKS